MEELNQDTTIEVILFDGECTLCNHSMQFILRHDPAGRFRFASLQSPIARTLLAQAGRAPRLSPYFVVLLEHGKVFTRSTAALRITRRLNGLWPLVYLLILIPTPLRDLIYDLIARNRYRLFGREQLCLLPTQQLQDRFLS